MMLLLAALVWLALLALRDEVDRRRDQASAIASAKPAATQEEHRSATASARTTTATSPTLPATGVAQSPADHDRDVASCRLAMEVVRCEQHAMVLETVDRKVREGQRDPTCRDVRSDIPPWKLLLAAARAGHVPSMARFATSQAVRAPGSLSEYDLAAVAAYREHAYEFLKTAAEAGDGDAVLRLSHEMIAGGRGTRAVPHDPLRGLAYAQALLRRANPDYRQKILQDLSNGTWGFRPSPKDWEAVEPLSRTILPAIVQARLEGWTPTRVSEDPAAACDY